ncbi:MAG: domain containing protein [Blastococcus sp.]|nr:domain containing protein [Blastococcus sp.]
MRLKLTLLRSGTDVDDIVVTLDATATVGDLARTLAEEDPHADRPAVPGTLTLRSHPEGSAPTLLEPDTLVLESGVRSGTAISVAQAAQQFTDPAQARGPAVAVLSVTSGPDAGRTFELPVGASYIGRDHDCEVRLRDPLVSRRHARINVGDVVEVVDAQSANGVRVGEGLVPRAVLRAGETVALGDTVLTATLVDRQRVATGSSSPIVPFNRSPRLQPAYPGEEVVFPDPPGRERRQRFPLLAMVAPLFVGLGLFLATRSLLSLVFVAVSPLLMIGSYADQRIAARRDKRAEAAEFEAALAMTRARLDALLLEEQAARTAESPSVTESLEACYGLTPLLWSRRADAPGFLTVRLGLGRQASRHSVRMPMSNNTAPEHWQRLEQLVRDTSHVDVVPVVADLGEVGAVGVAGAAEPVAGLARGLVLQLTALHSPAELVVASIASPVAGAGWDWLKWLPHAGSVHSPLTSAHLAATPAAAHALVSELEELIGQRLEASSGPSLPGATPPGLPAVLLVVQDDAPVDRSRLVSLTESGAGVGVHVLWCAAAVERLPARCQAYVSVDRQTGAAAAGFVRDGTAVDGLRCESASADVALAAARRLAPVVDAGARVDDDSDLPRTVSLLGLIGPELAADVEAVVERWRESGSISVRDGSRPRRRSQDGTLRALIGQGTSEPFSLDLRTQGPHALVGGTTGSGKSEFLQSWVLGMAAAYSPDRVTFLFIDYKGGAAFSECVRLPHCVGLVTDLSPHLVRRALASLRAELRHREQVLNRKKAKDLLELERRGDPETPPSLVIVVDEFAALINEVPEFVEGVVDVAQRGRSLGLHLVLATQRPAGVIRDNLRANMNLRVALRMADEDNSIDVLGTPLAAGFDPAVPGRLAVKTGPGRITQCQSAYAGGHTSSAPVPPRIEVAGLRFGVGEVWEPRAAPEDAEPAQHGPADIARLVDSVVAAAQRAEIPAPRRPWQDELFRVYELAKLNQRTDEELALGVHDVPDQQTKTQAVFQPDTDGNMVVFGTGGSGKSTVLRTLALSAAVTPRSGPCHVYGLDFGAGGLAMLEDLPHVGAIITGDDHERITRLLRWLRRVVDDRAVRYAKVRASTVTEYRTLGGVPDEPRILLLVDGLASFLQEYEFTARGAWFQVFQQIATDGRQVGVHVVLSADRPGTLPASLGASVQRRLVLRLADRADYPLVGVADDVLGATSPPGRGVIGGLEVQVAVLGGSTNVAEQARAVAKLQDTLIRNRTTPAPEVQRLPERVLLGAQPIAVEGRPVLGISDETLGPVAFDPRGTFLVAGPPGSGRTTALASIVSSLCRWAPGAQVHYLGNRRSPLVGLGVWASVSVTPDEVDETARKLADQATLEAPRADAPVCVVIEGLTDFLSTVAELSLQSLVAAYKVGDHFVVADAETSALHQSWPLVQAVRAGRRGIALQPDQGDGDAVFRTAFPRVSRAEFPPGRGLLVQSGRVTRVQLVLPE